MMIDFMPIKEFTKRLPEEIQDSEHDQEYFSSSVLHLSVMLLICTKATCISHVKSYGMLNILSKILEGPSYIYALLSQNKLVRWPCEQMPGNEVIELSNIFRKLLYSVINVLIRFLFSYLTCSGGSNWEM